MPKMWSTRNYGTSSLYLRLLLRWNLGSAGPGLHALTLQAHERVYSYYCSIAFGVSLQQTSSLNTATSSEQQHKESCYPPTARSQRWHFLPTCTTTVPKMTRRTTTAHTVQVHLLSVVFQDVLSFLKRITRSVLHDWNKCYTKPLLLFSYFLNSSIHIYHICTFPAHIPCSYLCPSLVSQ